MFAGGEKLFNAGPQNLFLTTVYYTPPDILSLYQEWEELHRMARLSSRAVYYIITMGQTCAPGIIL